MIQVSTERLLLRVLKREDEAEFIRIHTISREHFAPFMPSRKPGQTLTDRFEEELIRTEESIAAGTDLRLVGVLCDGRIAGFFTLSQIYRRAFQSCYAGWHVSVDQVGKGLATEGVHGLLDLAFAKPPEGLSLHRVQANIIPAIKKVFEWRKKTVFVGKVWLSDIFKSMDNGMIM